MIGIVILNYRNWTDTLHCIKSIINNPPEEAYKIILIDNASPDSPSDDLKRMMEQYPIVFIRNKKNKGYNGGNNVGVLKALELGCDAILISNNDVRYFPGSIQTLWEYTKEHPNVGIVGPKILDIDGKVQKSNLCRKTGMKEKYLVRTRLNVLFRKNYRTYFGIDRNYDEIFEVYSVLGCCFLMTRACAEKVTPFDEHMLLYEEELVLGMRMEQAGYRTVYNPHAVIEHLHGGSTRHVKAFSFAHNVRSEIYYCREYLHAGKMEVYPLYLYRVFLYFLRCFKYKDFREHLRWFLRMTGEELKSK